MVFPTLAWPSVYTERDDGQGVPGGTQECLPLLDLIYLDASHRTRSKEGLSEPVGAETVIIP